MSHIPTYILRLKDVADHFVLFFGLRGPWRCLNAVLRRHAWHPPPRHKHHDVPDISDVGYGAQCVVHHCFLDGAVS